MSGRLSRQMKGQKVLIIEDDPTLLRGLRDNFQFEGYSTSSASDGEEGLQGALDLSPDLIILDIMLPKINGYELCRLIRSEKLEMPIIMLTAKGQQIDREKSFEAGADDYFVKPFSPLELIKKVEEVLG